MPLADAVPMSICGNSPAPVAPSNMPGAADGGMPIGGPPIMSIGAPNPPAGGSKPAIGGNAGRAGIAWPANMRRKSAITSTSAAGAPSWAIIGSGGMAGAA